MQIISKGGTVKIKLDQAEGRRMRDAAYISKRIAANLTDGRRAALLMAAADTIFAIAEEFTPHKEKLDREDKDTPPAGVKEK